MVESIIVASRLCKWLHCETNPFLSDAGGKAGFAPPKAGDSAYDEYVSDPAKPVPFRRRPDPDCIHLAELVSE